MTLTMVITNIKKDHNYWNLLEPQVDHLEVHTNAKRSAPLVVVEKELP